MSLKKEQRGVPPSTAEVAKVVYAKGNIYVAMHDKLGAVFANEMFAGLYGHDGAPAQAPWRLALVCVLQYLEELTDRQAAEAVKSRIDWKYLLELELTDVGFDSSVLCKFRTRVVSGELIEVFLQQVLKVMKEQGHLKGGGKQRTDSTHILAAVREVNRLGCVGETLRLVLNQIAQVAPGWLQSRVPQEWYDRYGSRIDLARLPQKKEDQLALAQQMGQDGQDLLDWLTAAQPAWQEELEGLGILRQVWQQQYRLEPTGIRWCSQQELPACEELIQSPFDVAARYATKRGAGHTGYKVHYTETCDDDLPHLIVNVATTTATTSDVAMLKPIHAALAEQDVLPAEQYLDSGYVNAELLIAIPAMYHVELVAQVREAPSRVLNGQPQLDHHQFEIDWDNRVVTCPQGQHSTIWSQTSSVRYADHRHEVIKVRFAKTTCDACPQRATCTSSTTAGRSLELLPKPEHDVLEQARATQETDAFQKRYKRRAGVEGTISQAVRGLDSRRSRYRGLDKTHLHNVLTAAAINLQRWFAWEQKVPLAKTRCSPFKALAVA